jgi:hypothetical protein
MCDAVGDHAGVTAVALVVVSVDRIPAAHTFDVLTPTRLE